MKKILFALLVFALPALTADFDFRCSQHGKIAQYLTDDFEFIGSTLDEYVVVDFDRAKTRKHAQNGGIVVDAWFVYLHSKSEKSKAGYSLVLFSYDMQNGAFKVLSMVRYACDNNYLDRWHNKYSSDYSEWEPIIPNSIGEVQYDKIKEALAR